MCLTICLQNYKENTNSRILVPYFSVKIAQIHHFDTKSNHLDNILILKNNKSFPYDSFYSLIFYPQYPRG